MPATRPRAWLAPVEGWRTDQPPGMMSPKSAAFLQNWFPEAGYIRARNGSYVYASGLGGPVNSLMPWAGTGSYKLFAASGANIFDVSGSGPVGAAVVTGLTNDHWSWALLSTGGGQYLTIVNGSDQPRQYTASAWSTPAFTGPSNNDILSVALAYKERLYFIQKNSTIFWYGGTSAITGALLSFDVGPTMKFGGTLVAMGVWTMMAYTGPIQFIVFVTSEGELVIWSGSNPGDSTNWSLLGTCKMSPPLGGDRCLYNVGGDLAVMTMDGVIPVSKAFMLDPSASDIGSITARIAPTWLEVVQTIGTTSPKWQFLTFARRRMAIVNIPDLTQTYQYVMNTETKAWTTFVGMQANCWCEWETNLYFGDANGNVQQAEYGSNDNGAAIDCIGVGAWERGDGISERMPSLISLDAQLGAYATIYGGVAADYSVVPPSAIAGGAGTATPADWGVADWGVADWPGTNTMRLIAAANCPSGVALAPAFRALVAGQPSSYSNCAIYGGSIVFEQGGFI